MNRSPLLLTNDVRFCVSGTVTIHPTAAIATNVILRANPDSCLVIGAGVVIGEGCVLQSYGGSLVIEDGVTLGSQVLLVGRGAVHRHACIGSLSTLMAEIAVAEGSMIPAGSLVGAPEPQLKQCNGLTSQSETPADSAKDVEEQSHGPADSINHVGDTPKAPADSINHVGDTPKAPADSVNHVGDTPKIPAAAANDISGFQNQRLNGVNQSLGKSAATLTNAHEKNPQTLESPSETADSQPKDDSASTIPHPDSHRMFMPINTPRYSGGAVDRVNEGRELGKSSSSESGDIQEREKSQEAEIAHGQEKSQEDKVGDRIEKSQENGKGDSIEDANGSNGANNPSASSVIYGRASVQRLMTMMFPYRTLNNSGDDKE